MLCISETDEPAECLPELAPILLLMRLGTSRGSGLERNDDGGSLAPIGEKLIKSMSESGRRLGYDF